MKKSTVDFLVSLYFVFAALFVATVFTSAYLSDNETSTGNSFTAMSWTVTPTPTPVPTPAPVNVVINEFMPNPLGTESTAEWIEVLNIGGSSVDINGWVLYDAWDSHALPISSANVVGGGTVIATGGYAVVNRAGDADFSLNNDTDTIRLYDGPITAGLLIDNYTYVGTIENKTYSKIPDGTGIFSNNHTPTPGGPNV